MKRSRYFTSLILFGFIALFLSQTALFASPVKAARPTRPSNLVIFSWSATTPLLTSLSLDKGVGYDFNESTIITKDTVAAKFPLINWDFIDVIIIDGYLPSDQTMIEKIMYYVNGSTGTAATKKGLLFFGANYTECTSDALLAKFSEVLPANFVANREAKNTYLNTSFANITGADPYLLNVYGNYSMGKIKEYNIVDNQVSVSLNPALDVDPNFLFKVPRIAWGSCPLLAHRIQTYAPTNLTTDKVVVREPSTDEPLVIMRNGTAKGRVLYFSPGTFIQNKTWDSNKLEAWNDAFALWPYFNYLIFLSIRWADQAVDSTTIETYAEWPYSPIPHAAEATAWMLFVASLWVFNFVLFFVLGRKSKRQPPAAATPAQGAPPSGESSAPKPPAEENAGPGEPASDKVEEKKIES